MEPDSRAEISFSFARRRGVLVEWPDGREAPPLLLIRPDTDESAIKEARRVFGRPLRLERLSAEAFETHLAAAFQEADAADGAPLVFELEETGKALPRDLLEEDAEAPVIQLVNQLMRQALRLRASDLHVEPMEQSMRVRIRVDGVLQTILERRDLPNAMIISRLKVMAGLDIAERRLPQDGRIGLRLGGRSIDVRISTIPAQFGERIVLRFLDRNAGLMTLDEIGLSRQQLSAIRRIIGLPNGIILATGPTGSGKTTTLYSMLKEINEIGRNILTIEDPIEYDLPGIGQSQINSQIGMTFAAGLRAILRQDPDVILVGEIRDAETARIAIQAAMTGHLVLSSLHTNNSAGAFPRLRDLGAESFLVASTVRGVIAQRLARRLCPACKRPRAPTAEEIAMLEAHKVPAPPEIFDAAGCPECENLGFWGRFGVYELIEMTPALRALTHDEGPEAEIERIALPTPARMRSAALRAVVEGRTTFKEAVRIVSDTT